MRRFLKCLPGVFAVCIVLGLMFTPSISVSAASNNSRQNAYEIKTNVPFKSTFESGDSDWYVYTVENNESVYFNFNTITDDISHHWALYVYDENGNQMETHNYPYSRWFSTWNGTYIPGSKLYVKVVWDHSYGVGVKNTISYSIEARRGVYYDYEVKGNWETENNSSNKLANEINKKKPILGVLNIGSNDTDVYKYVVAGDGKFYFQMVNQGNNTNAMFNMDFYDVKGNHIDGWYNNSGIITWTSGEFDMPVGSVVYVHIGSKNKDAKGEVYELSVIDNSVDVVEKLSKPLSILQKTNVVVGYSLPNATVYAQIGDKNYSAKADENGLYKIVTPTLKKNASVKIWQKEGKTSSNKATYKVTEK